MTRSPESRDRVEVSKQPNLCVYDDFEWSPAVLVIIHNDEHFYRSLVSTAWDCYFHINTNTTISFKIFLYLRFTTFLTFAL
jgi:hypothetical protein